ncbi:hypothetical protein Hanom_Chr03g00249011 [Helianthus anomalus]
MSSSAPSTVVDAEDAAVWNRKMERRHIFTHRHHLRWPDITSGRRKSPHITGHQCNMRKITELLGKEDDGE